MADWLQKDAKWWQRSDGAEVIYDEYSALATAKPWLPHHRGWDGFGPQGLSQTLSFRRKNTWVKIRRKFKTPEAAMKAVDAAYPAL
jgi:hypothetical protein